MEEDTICSLENYTGRLTGLQKLVVTMANGYEVAMEDVRSLVASTLDVATQWDHTFIVGASQALADWTAKYQHAMSQGKGQSMHDQLAHWDHVREAGNCPILPHYNPNHRAWTKHDVRRDIPDPYTGLLPTCSGPD